MNIRSNPIVESHINIDKYSTYSDVNSFTKMLMKLLNLFS